MSVLGSNFKISSAYPKIPTLREAGHEDDEEDDETQHVVDENLVDHDDEGAQTVGGPTEEEQLEGQQEHHQGGNKVLGVPQVQQTQRNAQQYEQTGEQEQGHLWRLFDEAGQPVACILPGAPRRHNAGDYDPQVVEDIEDQHRLAGTVDEPMIGQPL